MRVWRLVVIGECVCYWPLRCDGRVVVQAEERAVPHLVELVRRGRPVPIPLGCPGKVVLTGVLVSTHRVLASTPVSTTASCRTGPAQPARTDRARLPKGGPRRGRPVCAGVPQSTAEGSRVLRSTHHPAPHGTMGAPPTVPNSSRRRPSTRNQWPRWATRARARAHAVLGAYKMGYSEYSLTFEPRHRVAHVTEAFARARLAQLEIHLLRS